MTTDEFIRRSLKVHAGYYGYDRVVYAGPRVKVEVTCFLHGSFLQAPYSHMAGNGCPRCSNVAPITTDVFIEKAIEKHGMRFCYSLVHCTRQSDSVKIICSKHGVFEQIAANHLAGNGCRKCCRTTRLTQDEFVARATSVHNGRFDYSKALYLTNKHKVTIICHKHGEFRQLPGNHLKGHSCPECRKVDADGFRERMTKRFGDRYGMDDMGFVSLSHMVKLVCRSHGEFAILAKVAIGNQVELCKQCNAGFKWHPNQLTDEAAETPCYLYLLKISTGDESFLKLGISADVELRASQIRKSIPGSTVCIVASKRASRFECATMEYECHFVKYAEFRVRPSCEFPGMLECYPMSMECVLTEYVNSLSNPLPIINRQLEFDL